MSHPITLSTVNETCILSQICGWIWGACPFTLTAFCNCLPCRLRCTRELNGLWLPSVQPYCPGLEGRSDRGCTSVLSDMSTGKPTTYQLLFAVAAVNPESSPCFSDTECEGVLAAIPQVLGYRLVQELTTGRFMAYFRSTPKISTETLSEFFF